MIGMVKIGENTRFTLELPWFSVWVDFTEMVLACYRQDNEEFAMMIVHELEDAAFRAIRADVHRAVKVARDVETLFTVSSTKMSREALGEALGADARQE